MCRQDWKEEQVLLAHGQREVYAGSERIYDAWGMPVSPKKLVNNDHGNWYQYCWSNPILYMDPDGKDPVTITIGAAVIAGMIASGVASGVFSVILYKDMKYPELLMDDMIVKNALLKECKIQDTKSFSGVKIILQDSNTVYRVSGAFYKSRDWTSFVEKASKGDEIRMLICPSQQLTIGTVYDVFELVWNNHVIMSFEEAKQIKKSYTEKNVLRCKRILLIFIMLEIVIGAILLFRRKYL